MRFLIDKKYLEVTKRELEGLRYRISVTGAEDGKVIIDTEAGQPECFFAACRAYLESLGEVDSLIPVTEEELEDAGLVRRLARADGKHAFVGYGTQEEILAEMGLVILCEKGADDEKNEL